MLIFIYIGRKPSKYPVFTRIRHVFIRSSAAQDHRMQIFALLAAQLSYLLIYWAHWSLGPDLLEPWSAAPASTSQIVPGAFSVSALHFPASRLQFSAFRLQFPAFQAPEPPTSRSQATNSRNLGYLNDWILSNPRLESHFWSPRSQTSSFPPDFLIFFELVFD